MNVNAKKKIEEKLQGTQCTFLVEKKYISPINAALPPNEYLSPHLAGNGRGKMQIWQLYDGIDLTYFDLLTEQASFHHPAFPSVLEINYCRYGRIGLEMQDGRTIYLVPGDFSVHAMDAYTDSHMSLPLGFYEGITICINLARLTAALPELLWGTGLNGEILAEKFCKHGTFSIFPGGRYTAFIFEEMFDLPPNLQYAVCRLKVMELLIYLYRLPLRQNRVLRQYRTDLIRTIKEMHSYLIEHLNERITINELSQRYLINPTTLKDVFKTVYGDSIAARIKEYRMEKAASLLRETEYNMTQVANMVGYNSQSKFATAFKEKYGMLPTEYRRKQ